MKILYLSVLASNKTIDEVLEKNANFSSYAVQKFNRLVVEGLARNGQIVTALSTFFQPNLGLLWHHHKEEEHRVHYRYIPSPTISLFRRPWILLYCFVYVFLWGMYQKKNKVLVCDVLNVSACTGAVAAARLIGLRRVGVMTDMPGLMVGAGYEKKPQKGTTLGVSGLKANKRYLDKFTHYVFLTEKMNEVNIHQRPYIIMEGLVDADMPAPDAKDKETKQVVLYAGGLHERYGLKMLVEGFMAADIESSELWLYGDGPFVEALKGYCKKNSRIRYFGTRPNNEIVDAECRATLLVNPRPTHEEFTKYSFPSKNMEYMVSGTPLLTTKLPGMPQEYYPYVYLFDKGETIEGYATVLHDVLSLSDEELQSKGGEARKWVLENKNHLSQTKRIIDLLII